MKNILFKLTFILITCSPAFGAEENIDMLNIFSKSYSEIIALANKEII